jgi:hypothetical protein
MAHGSIQRPFQCVTAQRAVKTFHTFTLPSEHARFGASLAQAAFRLKRLKPARAAPRCGQGAYRDKKVDARYRPRTVLFLSGFELA